jgi:heme/copper-type cytochrome/quinol oxidase subunit 4
MSESSSLDIKSTVRLCGVVLFVIACTTAMMITISFAHLGGWPLKVTLILGVAVVNAFLVASYLMHLLSEKKMVFVVGFFTVCFFISLMGLTLWAMQDFPVGTTH